jgi:hypothetical protein
MIERVRKPSNCAGAVIYVELCHPENGWRKPLKETVEFRAYLILYLGHTARKPFRQYTPSRCVSRVLFVDRVRETVWEKSGWVQNNLLNFLPKNGSSRSISTAEYITSIVQHTHWVHCDMIVGGRMPKAGKWADMWVQTVTSGILSNHTARSELSWSNKTFDSNRWIYDEQYPLCSTFYTFWTRHCWVAWIVLLNLLIKRQDRLWSQCLSCLNPEVRSNSSLSTWQTFIWRIALESNLPILCSAVSQAEIAICDCS